jgi:hypothetical protein
MTTERRQRRSTVTRREALLKLLGLLGRPGACVHTDDMASGSARIPVRGERDGALLGEVPRETLADALRRGLVGDVDPGPTAPHPVAGALRLTASGRRTLRKARTEIAALRASASYAASRKAEARPQRPASNQAESPLSWLRYRRDAAGRPLLDDAQFQAGERLRTDLTLAGLTPRVTMSWTGIPGGGGGTARNSADDITERRLAASTRVARALEAVGPDHAGILVDVCGFLKGLDAIGETHGWPRRSGRLILQHALSALARHYGLISPADTAATIAVRLRHWGVEGYRPGLERWRTEGDGDAAAPRSTGPAASY